MEENKELVMHKILIMDFLETRIDDLRLGASTDHDFWHGQHLEGVAKELEEIKKMINGNEFSEDSEPQIPLSEALEFAEWCSRNGWRCYQDSSEWFNANHDREDFYDRTTS